MPKKTRAEGQAHPADVGDALGPVHDGGGGGQGDERVGDGDALQGTWCVVCVVLCLVWGAV